MWLHKKWSFPFRISLVNVSKSAETTTLVKFTEEIFNGKLYYLCTMREASDNLFKQTVVEDYLEPYLISITARFSEIGE